MKIVIKTKNIELNQALTDYVEEKIGSLERFVEDFNEEFDEFFGKGKSKMEMWVEIGKETRHHIKGDVYRAEAQTRLPGKSIRSVATSHDLRVAIDEVKDEMQRELKKYKGKIVAQAKRGARIRKKLTNLNPFARFRRNKGERLRE